MVIWLYFADEGEDEDDDGEIYTPGEMINATDVLELGKKRVEMSDGNVAKQSSLDDGLNHQPTMSYEHNVHNSNLPNDIDSIPKEPENVNQHIQYSNVDQPEMQSNIRYENEIVANIEHDNRPIEEPIRSDTQTVPQSLISPNETMIQQVPSGKNRRNTLSA